MKKIVFSIVFILIYGKVASQDVKSELQKAISTYENSDYLTSIELLQKCQLEIKKEYSNKLCEQLLPKKFNAFILKDKKIELYSDSKLMKLTSVYSVDQLNSELLISFTNYSDYYFEIIEAHLKPNSNSQKHGIANSPVIIRGYRALKQTDEILKTNRISILIGSIVLDIQLKIGRAHV